MLSRFIFKQTRLTLWSFCQTTQMLCAYLSLIKKYSSEFSCLPGCQWNVTKAEQVRLCVLLFCNKEWASINWLTSNKSTNLIFIFYLDFAAWCLNVYTQLIQLYKTNEIMIWSRRYRMSSENKTKNLAEQRCNHHQHYLPSVNSVCTLPVRRLTTLTIGNYSMMSV